MKTVTEIENILEKSRWAPSGDNEQPWRIRVLSPNSCEVTVGYFLNTLFHLKRIPDHIALGSFLETMSIVASELGMVMKANIKDESSGAPVYLVSVSKTGVLKDTLAMYIEKRTVNRFPYSRERLTGEQKSFVERNLPTGFKVLWFEEDGLLSFAKVVYASGVIRYMIPEMFEVHARIVDWKKEMSVDKVPSKAMGVPIFMLPLVRWFLGSWNRMNAYNKILAGHVVTALQLDFLPSYFSASGIALVSEKECVTAKDWVEAGRAIQRFWLSTTFLGLSHQPAFTPLLFTKYADQGQALSSLKHANLKNQVLSKDLANLVGGELVKKKIVWMGRVGRAKPIQSRSIRRPLEDLILR